MRIAGQFAIFFVLVAATSFARAEAATFCQRLAPQLGMRPLGSAARPPISAWRVNLLGGLGPALFGGTTVASFSVGPIGDVPKAEEKRSDDACTLTGKGVICQVQGPARLTIGTKKGKVVADAAAQEKAVVEMRTTTITCRDP